MSHEYTYVVIRLNEDEPAAVFRRKYELNAWVGDRQDLRIWRIRDDGRGGVMTLIREDQEE